MTFDKLCFFFNNCLLKNGKMKQCLFLKVALGDFVIALSSIDFYGGNIGKKSFFFF
jgi:hypothetical protein